MRLGRREKLFFGGRRPAGQGLLESVVSIGIITTGVIASLALVVGSLTAGQQSADQLVAENLAWEGVEVVRNIRDSNYLSGGAWDSGLTGADTTAIAVFNSGTNTWALDFAPNALTDAATQMYRDGTGIYVQNTATPAGTPTNFYRLITIDPQGTAFMKRVVSQVRWVEKGNSRSISVETNLYNWK